MTLEDFTTYTIVEELDRITVDSSTQITFDGISRNEDTYIYKDKTAGYFGNYTHNIEFMEDGASIHSSMLGIWGVTNSIDDFNNWSEGQYVYINLNTSPSPDEVNVSLGDKGNSETDSTTLCLTDTRYYLVIERDGTTCTCKIYTDAEHTEGNRVDTLTITCENTTYRYIYAGGARDTNSGTTNDYRFYGKTYDLELDASTASNTTYYTEGNSLRIYISCNNYPNNYIDCWCTRWDEGNWDLTFETFLGSGARDFLFSNVTPGATSEMYNILGTPHYIDSTYSSGNSIICSPIGGTGLSGLRQQRTIAVKSISDKFINKDMFGIKVEGVLL